MSNRVPPAWMPNVRVAEYLGLSDMSIWRYDNHPRYAHLKFPKPAIINGRKYRSRAALDAWVQERVKKDEVA